MKNTLNLPLLFVGLAILPLNSYGQKGYSPPCNEVKQIKLDTSPVRCQILVNFIRDCVQNEWKNDKGIVLLRAYQNEQGKTCWLLSPSIDDSYRDNPPERFASFIGDIILVFAADSVGNVKPSVRNKEDLNRCPEQIIGDRVYTRPTLKTRWTDMVRPFTTEKMKEGIRRIWAGNGGDLIIVFNADGTYKKVLPV